MSCRLWCTVGTDAQFAFLALALIDIIRFATDFALGPRSHQAACLIQRATSRGATDKGHGRLGAGASRCRWFRRDDLEIRHKDVSAGAVGQTASGLLAALTIYADVAHANRLAFILTSDDERFDDL